MELLKVLFGSWPLAMLLLGCFALLILKKPFNDLIGRVRGKLPVGSGEVTLDPSSAAASQAEVKPAETGLVLAELDKRLQAVRSFDVPPIVTEQENLIQADLERLGVSEREQIEILVKHLAVTQLLLRAEVTYRTIFGSQIFLLRFLNLAPGTGGTREKLAEFYESARAQSPDLYANYSFEQYLHYLLSQGLIVGQDPERYVITVAGKEFLKWMSDASVTENKPF
jgi:hypothetical protein